MEMTGTEELALVLSAQNDLLDGMIAEQAAIRACVRDRQWDGLEQSINKMEAFSDSFLSLDARRQKLCATGNVLSDPKVSDLMAAVRSKLARSKIENQNLSTYVSAAQDLAHGIVESCASQHRTTTYSPYGIVKRPTSQSVMVNTLF